ncbi:PREDICTED: type IV inositol polyphosphate 5-phosphatase 7-like [Nelumbo nucifera]|uniref:Type IV inositol polyphosphate 5-phosphatase 7-like n=1 Tax=Nelumbo nucifera TaxID=4432 RepID=A0A1U7ZTU2_NELNU|nr:PREDICTED: type IV inositol polyphosphate 5-phosphatase 7-like [Nelumbo nucifera]
MDFRDHHAPPRRLRNWFKWKNKGERQFHYNEVSDSDEDEDIDCSENGSARSLDMGSFILTNELRVFVGTWNVAGRSPVGSLAVDLDDWLNLKDPADIYVLGFQEVVPLKARNVIGAEDTTVATKWNSLIGKTLNNKFGCPWLTPMLHPVSGDNYYNRQTPGHVTTPARDRPRTTLQEEEADGASSKYKLMASKKMVGIFISVWMKRDLVKNYCISNVKGCSVACGIMGYLGNKGSVSVSMSIEGTSFCFIAAHLASGEKKGDEMRRNYQVAEIFRRTSFPRLPQDDDNPHPLSILGHDRIFWLGDLNYRLCLEDGLARQLIRKQDWRSLQKFDQLRKEQEDGGVFQGWREASIEFAPTYKYSSSNCNRYSGGLPSRAGEKQRTPAWCDRILWYGKGVKQLCYHRSESRFSDHRPVCAVFSSQIEVVKSMNPPKVTSVAVISPLITQSEGKVEGRSTLQASMMRDINEASSKKTPLPFPSF